MNNSFLTQMEQRFASPKTPNEKAAQIFLITKMVEAFCALKLASEIESSEYKLAQLLLPLGVRKVTISQSPANMPLIDSYIWILDEAGNEISLLVREKDKGKVSLSNPDNDDFLKKMNQAA